MRAALRAEIGERNSRNEATLHYEKALQWVECEFKRRRTFVTTEKTADIINIPLVGDDLYLLKLIPQDRTAMFRYVVEDGCWLIIECHVDTGIIVVEENREREGGWTQVTPKAPSIDKRLAGQVERITKGEYAMWDTASASERIALWVTWTDDTMRIVEDQLRRALQRPRGEESPSRYNYDALAQLARVLRELEAEKLAYRDAIQCLR